MGKGFKVADAYVSVTADDEGLRESMTAKVQAAAEGLDASVKVTAKDDGLKADITAKVAAAEAGEQLEIPLVVEDEEAAARLKAQLEELGHEASVVVNVDTGAAEVKLGELAAEAEVVKKELGDVGSSGGEAAQGLDAAGNSAANAGNAAAGASGGMGGMSGVMMGLIGAAVALAPALAALPALLSGLGLGGIAAFGALKDVVGALTAANQSAGAAGQSAAAAAQTAFSNAVAIQNAEQSIADAKRQAAIAAQNSADSITAANAQVQQSEQNEAIAAQQLAQAKVDAYNQIADLNNSAADANNSVADAQLSAQQAQQNLTSVMANSLSTDLQKQQAQQALVDAQQRVTDAQQHATEATQAATTANQEGVANFPPVVQAQRAYEQSVTATANAQHALAVAVRNASDQQISSAEAVQKAETSLTDTYKQQQLAAAAAAQSGASGANAYAQAMAKLTPVGQEVVKMLLGMNTGMSAASQNSFLPGILSFLKDVLPIMPQFVGLVSQAGQAFGGFIAQIGKLFTNQKFVAEFFTVLQQGVGLMSTIGGGVIQMIQGVTSAASQAGPIVTAVGQGIADIFAAIGPLLQGLVSGGTGAAQSIQAVLDLVAGLLGPLGTLIGAVSGALGPALHTLVPVLLTLVNSVVKALLPSLPQLSTALSAVANILAILIPFVVPLIGYLGTGLANALTVVSGLLQGLSTFVKDNISWLGPLTELVVGVIGAMKLWALAQWAINLAMTANPIGLLITAIVALVAGVVYAYDHFQWFRDFIQQTWQDLQNWFFDGWHFIDGIWQKITGGGEGVVTWFQGLPGRLGSVLSGLFDPLWQGFKGAINWIIRGWDGLKFTLPSIDLGPLGHIGGWTVGVPQIPQLAKGGTAIDDGLAIVGDAGPELAYMQKGATIVPLTGAQSGTAAAGPRSGGVHIGQLTVPISAWMDLSNPNGMSAAAREFVRQLRDALKLLEGQYA